MDKNILKGPDYHMDLPKESLGKLFYDGLIKYNNKTVFVDEFTGETITNKKILEITTQLCGVFENLSLKEGDLIGIYSENSIYYFIPMIAASFLGITTVPISNYYLEAELTHALNLTKPSILFCSKESSKNFSKIREKFGFIKHVVVMDFTGFNSFLEKNGEKNGVLSLKEVNSEENVALILFSSGTTGLPKGVMITQKNFICRTVHCRDPRLKYFEPKDVILGILPFFHASGLMTYTVSSILLGHTLRVFSKFDPNLYLEAIQKYKLTQIQIVPTVTVFLAKNPIVDQYDLSNLEDILTGGSPLSENVEKRIMDRLKIKHIRQIYGMTETTLNITCVPVGLWKQGSVGKLVPGMMAAIRDPESGEFLSSYKIGEVIVKGDMVMKGYFKNPDANNEVFLENGFLRTGDLGYFDDEGNYFIVDRLKELIKYKSFQVAPAELEGLLLKNPKILDAGVIGLPDEEAGELPLAFVVKQPHAHDLSEEEVIKYVSDNVSHQKRLRGGVKFVEAIPKNASGKILRRELRKMIGNISKSKL
ncbi:luciferin 4-monooxygenase-like [Onthophagus taurus]|uniref:luciferin 4-monooxygenase-like n=1 Tax=Onthophagus taurus TaxID=166361 RepID=UPI000C20C446|nr:luciferin 4-monooxygenase-like [Onthophagus taurus]